MRWGDGGDDAISTSSQPNEQESADQQGSDGTETDGSRQATARAEVISMTSDMSNNTSLI